MQEGDYDYIVTSWIQTYVAGRLYNGGHIYIHMKMVIKTMSLDPAASFPDYQLLWPSRSALSSRRMAEQDRAKHFKIAD